MPVTSGDLEAVGDLVRAVSVEGRSRNQLSRLKDGERGEEIGTFQEGRL